MTSSSPPRLATWMLLHLMPHERDEALAGDLFESFRAGRSSGWYWRQVLVAIAIRWIGSLFRHWPVMAFAAAWATLAPGWWLLIVRLYQTHNLNGPIWRLSWPWSMVCATGISTAESLLFIWTGVVIYLLMLRSLFRTAKQWRFGRAFAASLASYVLVSACELPISLILAHRPTNHGMDWRTLTVDGVIGSFGIMMLLMRLPYLIATVCALWGAIPADEPSTKLVD
jgi:hypothetical protein